MTTVMKFVASGVFAITLCVTNAVAEGKGMSINGSVEAGYATTWTSATTTNGFLLDAARLNMEHNVSDSVKVVFHNAFAVTNGSAAATDHNSSAYFSGATMRTAYTAPATGMNLIYSNMAAYVDFKCGEKFHTWVGHFNTPFGMESMWERWNMNSYYYSQTYSGFFKTMGWNQDLGIKLALIDVLPGMLEVAILNDMNVGASTPAIAARWSYEMKSGDSSLTPVISGYFGNFANAADIGVSGGAMWKMGAIWANAEFLFGKGRGGNQNWGLVAEPGFDAGIANISAKFELASQDTGTGAVSDINLGAAISHEYSGGYRVKLAYNHLNLGGKGTGHANDLRLLFGAKF